ncbi:MAG: hypothetical protein IJC57_03470 [Clostridia bacterium]|nr:hypothetical protein [Clostridia bacterium]
MIKQITLSELSDELAQTKTKKKELLRQDRINGDKKEQRKQPESKSKKDRKAPVFTAQSKP